MLAHAGLPHNAGMTPALLILAAYLLGSLSGSLLLASNNFYREFTDDPEITEEAAALPQMGGSGPVRDLREAMSLETDEAEELQDSVQAFAAATTRQAQLALINDWVRASHPVWESSSASRRSCLRLRCAKPPKSKSSNRQVKGE